MTITITAILFAKPLGGFPGLSFKARSKHNTDRDHHPIDRHSHDCINIIEVHGAEHRCSRSQLSSHEQSLHELLTEQREGNCQALLFLHYEREHFQPVPHILREEGEEVVVVGVAHLADVVVAAAVHGQSFHRTAEGLDIQLRLNRGTSSMDMS